MAEKKIIVGMTGASGAVYAVRLVQTLLDLKHDVHLVASPTATAVFAHELKHNKKIDFPGMFRQTLGTRYKDAPLMFHPHDQYATSIASGSFLTDGMVVAPCSTGSLAAIATGNNRHLIHRAAEVHLKERRPLILLVREAPYSLLHLENMTSLTHAGGIILPASPPFYHQPETIFDLVDAMIARMLDLLKIEHSPGNRYTPDRAGW